MTTYELAKAMENELRSWRRELHRHPELGRNEHFAQEFICARLDEMGILYQREATAVLALIRGRKEHPLIGLRADMDALPIREQTGLPFASQNDGCMHACGHDCHMAMLLGAAQLLQGMRDELDCSVRLIFQPAEETVTGAASIIGHPALQGMDTVFAIHIWSYLELGKISLEAGPRMAAAGAFKIHIRGRNSHCGRPQDGADAVLAAANVVQALQSVVSRRMDPFAPVVLNIGKMTAGTAFNIMAGEAELAGTTRYFDPALTETLPRLIGEIAAHAAAEVGAEAKLEYESRVPPVINDTTCSALAEQAVAKMGAPAVTSQLQETMISEDFSLFMGEAPGCLAFLGGRNEAAGQCWPHHHERFDVDEAALPIGTALYVQYALEAAQHFA